jgi:tetrahydromethanopterin S-methyltransferase subunit A
MVTATDGWPVTDGSFVVGDPAAPVAVCVLTSADLMPALAALPGVAIAGEVQTANLGLERIVTNVVANPAIRFLLLCGKESKLFRPGQSLLALLDNGLDETGRITGALGYEPVLRGVPGDAVRRFRAQVEVADWTGEVDLAPLRERVAGLARRSPGPFQASEPIAGVAPTVASGYVQIRPGGTREPLRYDPKGYFVITLDRPADQVVVRHNLPDHRPAHEMRGRNASSLFLGLLRERLVTQLSHAGYLGGELARAEAALRLGLRYQQDRPLRHDVEPGEPPAPPVPTGPLDAEHLAAMQPGAQVDVAVQVREAAEPGELVATLLEAAEPGPAIRKYRLSSAGVRVRWGAETRVAMGDRDDVAAGAVLRIRGTLDPQRAVVAEAMAVLTAIATVAD